MADADLLFKILADSSQAVREVKSFGTNVTRELNKVTGDAGTAKAGLAGMVGPAGAVATAVAGIALSAAGAAAAIVALTKEAVDYGSKINDMAIKTGLSTETLSGLDLQLQQSGSSLEQFTLGVFNLQKNIEAAEGSNKKMAATLKALGVTSTDTDTALRQLLKGLAAIPNEQERNALGAQVMGRAYKDLAVFVADTNGNIDEAIDKAREMGLVMSKETAAAADKLGDNLDQLDAQVSGLKRTVGEEFIPIVSAAIKDLSGWISQNRGEIKEWASTIASAAGALATWGPAVAKWLTIMNPVTFAIRAMITAFQALRSVMAMGKGGPGGVWDEGPSAVGGAVRSAGLFGTQTIVAEGGSRETNLGSNFPSIKSGGGGGGGHTPKAPKETADDRAGEKIANLTARLSELKRQYDAVKGGAIDAAKATEESRAAIEMAGKSYKDLSDGVRLLVLEKAREVTQAEKSLAQLVKDTETRKHARETYLQFIAGQEDALRTLTEGEDSATDALERQIQKLNEGGVALEWTRESYARLLAILIQVKENIAGLDLSKISLPEGFGTPGGDVTTNPLEHIFDETPPPDFTPHITALDALKQAGEQAFGSLAQGMGGVVQSFLMGEKVSVKAVLSMAKSIAAGLAAQALVESVMQLAHAWKEHAFAAASAAHGDLAGAAAHEIAAAAHMSAAGAFAIVGGVAAVAALAIPGGGTSGGGAVAGNSQLGGRSGTGTTSNERLPVEVSRNTGSVVTVILRSEVNPNAVVNSIVSDYQSNGKVKVLFDGGQLATP